MDNEPTKRIHIPVPEETVRAVLDEAGLTDAFFGGEPAKGVIVTVQQPSRWDEVRIRDTPEK